MMQLKRPSVILALILVMSAFAVALELVHLLYLFGVLFFVFGIVGFFISSNRRVLFFLLLCAFTVIYPALHDLRASHNAYNVCSILHNDTFTATVERISHTYDGTELYVTLDSSNKRLNGKHAVAVFDTELAEVLLYDKVSFVGTLVPISKNNAEENHMSSSPYEYYSRGYRLMIPADSFTSLGRNKSFDGISAVKRHFFYYMSDKLGNIMPNIENTDGFSYASALLTGDRSGIPQDTYKIFRLSGLAPFLCISGLHVAVATAFLSKFLRFIRTKSLLRTVLILIFLIFIVLITGASDPVCRAAFMSAVFIIAEEFFGTKDSIAVLASAFTIMAIHNPFFMFNVGSALSFLATFGVLCAGAAKSEISYKASGLTHTIRESLLSGFFAVGFTAQLTVSVFGGCYLLSPFSNIVASVIFMPIMYLLVLIAIFAFLPSGLLVLPCNAVTVLIRLFEKLASVFASIPFSYYDIDFPVAVHIILLVLFAITFILISCDKRKMIALHSFIYSAAVYFTMIAFLPVGM